MSPRINEFFFYSNEKERMHVHYKKDGKKAKFWLFPIELARNEGFSEHEINDILKKLKGTRNECVKKWKQHFGS